MRVSFFKRLAVTMLAFAFTVCAASLPAFAEEDKYYVVTFRPGDKGTITESTTVAAAETVLTGAGAAAYKIKAGTDVTGAPVVTPDAGYFLIGFVRSGTGNNVSTTDCYSGISALDRNYDYVAAYGLSSGDTNYAYVVRYVDSNGNEITASERGIGTDGASIIRSPRSVSGYTADSAASKTMVLKAGGEAENVLTFTYTLNVETVTDTVTSTTIVDGGVVTVVTGATTVTGGAAAGGAGATGGATTGGAAGAGTAEGAGEGETITDNETPRAENGTEPSESEAAASDETIVDEEVPNAAASSGKVNVVMVAGIVAVIVLAGAVIAYVIIKKKKAE